MTPYYEDDAVTIYHADCRELLPQLQAELVLTDPPYGVGFRYTDAYEDTPEAWRALIAEAWPLMRAAAPLLALTSGTRQLWSYPQPDGMLCWAHPGSTRNNTLGGFSCWEPVLVYGRRRVYQDLLYAPDCVNHTPEAAGHPCPKPLRLYQWLVGELSDPGALVIDPFMGSGTTLRAAKNLGRRTIGCDVEERYCEIAARRCAQEVLLVEAQPALEQLELA